MENEARTTITKNDKADDRKVIYNNLKFISQFYFQKIIMNSGIFVLEIYYFLNQLENNLYKKVKSEFSNKKITQTFIVQLIPSTHSFKFFFLKKNLC